MKDLIIKDFDLKTKHLRATTVVLAGMMLVRIQFNDASITN